MGSPLHIEPGLDGAIIELQLVRPMLQVSRAPASLYLYLGLGFAMLFTRGWWLGALMLLGGVVVSLTYLRRRVQSSTLRFEVTPTQILQNGRPVQVRADFQHVWVNEQQFVIDGGLTRKEHERLMSLMTRRARGEAAEVDPRLSGMRRERQ